MARRSDHSRDELREMAITAARDIVRSEGVQSLTTRAVAKRIGYTVGTLYHLFRNADDMILMVNVRTVVHIRQRMKEAIENTHGPEDKLRAMAHAYADYAFSCPDLWRLAFEHRIQGETEYPGLLTQETDQTFGWVTNVLAEVTGDTSDGELRLAAATLWSGVHGICHLAISDKLRLAGADAVSAVIDRLVDSVLAGLTSRGQGMSAAG